MLRDVFLSRRILAGLIFVGVAVAGTQLYSWHVRRRSEAEFERHDQSIVAGTQAEERGTPCRLMFRQTRKHAVL